MKTHLRTKRGSACGYEGERTTRFPSAVDCHACHATVAMADREMELMQAPRHMRLVAC